MGGSTGEILTGGGRRDLAADIGSASKLLRPPELRDEIRKFDGRHGENGHRTPGADIDRQVSDCLVVRRLHQGDEIVRAEQRVLHDHLAPERGNLVVHGRDPVRLLMKRFTTFRSKGGK